MKDFRGNEIVKGSLIAYPGRNGSSTYMTTGRVLEIKTVEKWGRSSIRLKVVRTKTTGFSAITPEERPVTLYALSNILVLKESPSDTMVACLSDAKDDAGSNPA